MPVPGQTVRFVRSRSFDAAGRLVPNVEEGRYVGLIDTRGGTERALLLETPRGPQVVRPSDLVRRA